MKSLYFKKEAYFVDMFGKIKSNQTTLYSDRNNCSSRQHIEQWLLINDLLNVACFLNNGWIPNWEDSKEEKYTIVIDDGIPRPLKINQAVAFVYFPCKETVEEAITIIGKEKLRLIFKADCS